MPHFLIMQSKAYLHGGTPETKLQKIPASFLMQGFWRSVFAPTW
jgi:hypothetical protein